MKQRWTGAHFQGCVPAGAGVSFVQKGDVPKGSPPAPLHQPQGTGGHSVKIHAGLGCLISNTEGIKVLGSVTVNSGQDENVICRFCLYKQYLAYSVPELVSCAVYFFC